MMKKQKGGSLGKSLIRDRFKKRNPNRDGDSFLHTSELNDGYDWGRLNLQSVTEQSTLDDFLTTAELAGIDFTAEKLNVKIVDVNKHSGLTAEEQENIKKLHEQHKGLLRIPRRPAWDSTTSGEDLNRKERDAFLEWRRVLSTLQEVDGIVMTPYEKNLDFWRQLWRVIERSDVIVQIVDARCPLLFYCEDLESYVKEVSNDKVNLLLINKADYLTQDQRNMWCEYFTNRNIKMAFWSALDETMRYEESKKVDTEIRNEISGFDEGFDESDDEEVDMEEVIEDKDMDENEKLADEYTGQSSTSEALSGLHDVNISENCGSCDEKLQDLQNNPENENNDMDHICARCGKEQSCSCNSEDSLSSETKHYGNDDASKVDLKCDTGDGSNRDSSETNYSDEQNSENKSSTNVETESSYRNRNNILNSLELLDLFKTLHKGKKVQSGITTVGMVGYPNVGKSSSINAILKTKKVPVSATPGRTKHFQTLFVDTDMMLCDCPGLVFPSFVSTKADLIVNGILPIDQMRDHIPPVSLVCQCIPRPVLESTYGINLPAPQEGEDPRRAPTAPELLNTYGYMRGFMTSNGQPDCPRSSRYILKDFVKGRLLYCHPPPGIDAEIFHPVPEVKSKDKRKISESDEADICVPVPSKLDKEFFGKAQSKIHSKGIHGVTDFARAQGMQHVATSSATDGGSPMSSQSSLSGKPWKKHNNRKKREKLKKVYNEHDV